MSVLRFGQLMNSYLAFHGVSTEPTNQGELIRYTADGLEGSITVAKGAMQIRINRRAIDDLVALIDGLRGGSDFALFNSTALDEYTKGTRADILKRDGPGCWYCGCMSDLPSFLTFEHLLAKSKGGNWSVENLVMACQPCNVAVGNTAISLKVRYREEKRNR